MTTSTVNVNGVNDWQLSGARDDVSVPVQVGNGYGLFLDVVESVTDLQAAVIVVDAARGQVQTYTVATVPAATGLNVGRLIWVTDGNAGAATPAISDGTNWKVIALGATISGT